MSEKTLYKERYNLGYIIWLCSVAALGGLLFGYDTAVISGAIGSIKIYFDLDSFGVGWAVSNVAVGCIVGAFCSGPLATRLGRKKTLIITAILFTVSAIGASLAGSFFSFVVYRMLGGVAVGIASAVSPMYMSEVSPKNIRGRALSMQNFAIVFGQVLIFIANYLIAKGMTEMWLIETGWRVMIASGILPCILFCIVVIFIPESPRWDAMMGFDERALKTLTRISNAAHAANVLRDIKLSIKLDSQTEKTQGKIDYRRDKIFWFIVFLASAVAVFQQASGVNVMMYYAPLVLAKVTSNTETALFMTIWVGVIQLIGTVIGSVLMDKVGRTILLKIGSLGAALGLIVTSYFLYSSGSVAEADAQALGYWTLFGMLFFMIFYAFSWGLGAWIVISEIFPNRMRSQGMSFAVTAMWISNFFVGLGFPILNENPYLVEKFHGAFPMWLFAGAMILAYFFIVRFLPETKGVSLEKMEEVALSKRFLTKEKAEETPL